jgi:hypothetical protein
MRVRGFPVLLGLLAIAACSTSTPAAAPSRAASASPAASAATASGTVWICRPGADAACSKDLDATVVQADGSRRRVPFVPAAHPPADCFYVYPTVSTAPGDNAPRSSSPEVLEAIHAQAALFASVCRVFVPAYRQVTVGALLSGRYFDKGVQNVAYADVRAAWRDYLAHDNGGRPVVLIGHSQGAMLLTRLVKEEIDGSAAVRRRLLSAILLGGNVTVATGRAAGGSFTAVPACTTPGATGCVIAYSSFATTPPAGALFGRTTAPGQHVLCTDPTRLAGGSGLAHPYVPAGRVAAGPQPLPGTGFVAYPDGIRVACRSAGGASWLQVAAVPGSRVPPFQASLGPNWGLHVADVTLAIGDLIDAVRRQEAG